MDETNIVTTGYQVPTYKLEPHQAWFHFLHGNVPGHQIDFMYRPSVPQSPLTRQHFSHLSRVVKYIEPRHANAYSFAITNLSRDDNQYEPGHGGVAFIFGLRIRGARDHAGRQDPPFCHSAALIDRHLDAQTLYGIAVQFYQKLLPDEESQAEGSGWYHTYVKHAEDPEKLLPVLNMYLADFADLHVPPPSRLSVRWSVEGATVPRRVVIVYPDRVDFMTLAYCMARIAAVLIESNIKWTAVSNGREQDVAGGLTVRFVPMREAMEASSNEALLYLEQVPENPAEIAAQLFNAHESTEGARVSRLPPEPRPVLARPASAEAVKANGAGHHGGATQESIDEHSRPWRTTDAAQTAEPEDPAVKTQGLGIVGVIEKKNETELMMPPTDWAAELKKKQRKQQSAVLVGLAFFIVVFGVMAAIWFASTPVMPPEEPAAASSAVAPRRPASAAPPEGARAAPSASVATESSSEPELVMTMPPPTIGAKAAGTAPAGTAKPKNVFDRPRTKKKLPF
jgi:hypothetical protein